MTREVEERDKEIQLQERWRRIQRSRSNKDISTLGLLRYLKEKGKEERMVRIAGFRMGREMRESRFWKRDENKKRRICGWEEETWSKYVWMRERGEKGKKY